METRTTTDLVYETLHKEILTLQIRPGVKLSESDVARRFNVSRQPVRNAFTKLGNQDLLVIRPQKATTVRGFSMERIALDRFVRMAVEIEVVKCAAKVWDDQRHEQLEQNTYLQEQAIKAGNLTEFHALDYAFHKLICVLGGNPLAFNVVYDTKQKVDRLCVLSLTKDSEANSVLSDHRQIVSGLLSRDSELAVSALRKHLTRLDATINFIHEEYPNYFE